MKELKVGERVTITLEVAEADGDSCKGCFFNHRKSCSEWRQYCPCSTKERLDRKNVISNNEYWLYVDDLLPKKGGEQ